MKENRGFSLIELLIVITIILVIVAIAVPSLMRSRISANEASAIASLRVINTAEISYSVSYPMVGFATGLQFLKPPPAGQGPSSVSAGLLDDVLGCNQQPCAKSGYEFEIVNTGGNPVVDTYSLTGVPTYPGVTGVRGFCSDQTWHITFDPNGATNCTTTMY